MSRQRLLRGICGLLQQQHSSQRAHQLATAAVAASVAAHPSAAHQPALLRSAAALYRAFTTSSARHSSLTSLLAEEVKYEKENYQRPEQVSGGPPAPFKLTEAPGDTLLTLTRSYKGEEVNVDLHVNNQVWEDAEAAGAREGAEVFPCARRGH
ncbi:hypothetical protein TSOC_009607 [Tetrabaena socialis]|uniref:Uncharacterized protein n=1 Tax=Tetrabaena socialis TaxID=47790 RepID=A0A2J7ZVE9_9CHLO|nr:hypothetical protein TSOC_009607 [Tetrabaena socialis]|eukprot:PNH04235.1 hypothetical protein TSOC_009607 [Tetrabaena socialis]